MLKRTMRSALAILLVFMMTFSLCSTALASMVNHGDHDHGTEINYVSLGDTMVSGYGIGYAEDTYAELFAKWLEDEGYADTVNHEQHGISTLRAEDLHKLLKSDDDLRDDVANADIISLGIGNDDIYTHMLGAIMEAVGVSGSADLRDYDIEKSISELNPTLQTAVLKLYENIKSRLAALGEVPAEIADTVLCAAVSFAINYAFSVQAIIELNADAEIILVGIMNPVEIEGAIRGVSLDKIMEKAVEALNLYLAGVPAIMEATGSEAAVYFAELPKVESIADTYGTSIDDNVRYDFYKAIVGEDEHNLGMIWKLLADVTLVDGVEIVYFGYADINNYEEKSAEDKLAYAYDEGTRNIAASISVYLAFEAAVIACADDTVLVDDLLGLSSILTDNSAITGLVEEFKEKADNAGTDKLDVIADFIAGQSKGVLESDKQLLTAEQVKAVFEGADKNRAAGGRCGLYQQSRSLPYSQAGK